MSGPVLSMPTRPRRGVELYTVSILAPSRVVLAVAYGSTPEQATRRAEKVKRALWDEVVVGEVEASCTTR